MADTEGPELLDYEEEGDQEMLEKVDEMETDYDNNRKFTRTDPH